MNDPEKLREAILARLASVIDPETGVDVVRMRLIENLTWTRRAASATPSGPPRLYARSPCRWRSRSAAPWRETPGVTGQAMRVEGYVGSDALNALLDELADDAYSA